MRRGTRASGSGGSAAVVLGLLGCAAPELATSSAPIVNGDVDPSEPAVVALLAGDQQFCTGTLVSPLVVVTAAHCLPPHYPVELADLAIYFGARVGEGGELRVADEAEPHPAWTVESRANDIGLIALSSPAPAAPLRMLVSPAPAPGEPARLVGYGITGDGEVDNGVKRAGMTVIESADATTLYLGPERALTCNGDSGGPLFVERDGDWVLAGIHSRSDCVDASLNERVDVHLAGEIEPFFARHGGDCADGLCRSACEGDDCGDLIGGCATGGGPGGVALALAAFALSLPARRRARASLDTGPIRAGSRATAARSSDRGTHRGRPRVGGSS